MTPEGLLKAAADRVLRFVFVGTVILLLVGCSKPSFISRKPNTETAPVATSVNFQVTPRELLTARLVNPPANENAPQITVGKLIEFADRYLSCDCSGTRFVRSWQRLPGGYRLTTNSDLVRPLDLACRRDGETTNCYLSEIDRGPQVHDLRDRFVPGSEFIQYMYENGLQCDREGPCPAEDPPA
jgi:hypothetical protein